MYESYFGLSGKPFKLSPDPKFFFQSPIHSKAISYLRYGLELGEGFIVITGPIGTGKTTIARSLLSSLSDSIVAAQIATTRLSPAELVQLVAAEFGIPIEGLSKADILKRFEDFLLNLNRYGKRALLIIDEAQNLPAETIEELRMLSNFQIDDWPLIQSFLLGQEELKPIIELPEMEQFRQRIIASCHLKALTHEETQAYIIHRIKQVGWNGRPDSELDIFERIALHTQGVPRKINIFMDRLFLYAYMESIETITLEHVENIIEEMNSELSGGLQSHSTNPLTNRFRLSSTDENSEKNAEQIDIERLYQTLHDVDHLLDEVIYRKTQTVKHLDKLIREKRKQLSDPDDIEEEAGKPVDEAWVKQLIKEKKQGR